MCMWDDAEAYEIYHLQLRTARKEHRCDECDRTIEPGERYRHATGLHDARWDTHHQCAHCCEVTRWLDAVCEGWLHHAVEEDLFEHVAGHERELRTRPLTRLARWMRADWRDRNGALRSIDDVATVVDEAIAAFERQLERAVA
jgi:hypothetical protein